MDNFDKLASYTPQFIQNVTKFGDVAGIGNFLSGGVIKANREIEKMKLQHAQNLELAKWNAQWNKSMDDTKAQRHMLDLQKAGINPILAHGQSLTNASGASSGSSGVASDSSADESSGKLKKAIKLLAALVLKSFGGN